MVKWCDAEEGGVVWVSLEDSRPEKEVEVGLPDGVS